jgi:hypothetical protein
VCNGDGTGPCLKPYQLKILCENSIRSKKKKKVREHLGHTFDIVGKYSNQLDFIEVIL